MFGALEWAIAARYLRARRHEGFISIIAWFSLIGIALGVATLIIVLSVMNGFRIELLDRVLGLNGHMVARGLESRLTGFDPIAEALRKVESSEFDVVLSDVVMPKMDGYELYRAIRASRPDLPVLMMTAFHYDKDHIIKRSRLAGLGTVIFKKPVDPDRLREAILEAVGSDSPNPS